MVLRLVERSAWVSIYQNQRSHRGAACRPISTSGDSNSRIPTGFSVLNYPLGSAPPAPPTLSHRPRPTYSIPDLSQAPTMPPTVEDMLNANLQWAKAVTAQEPDFFEQSSQGQSPPLLWFGCSDSRVPESVVTAARPGEIFTHRNIANQFHLHDDSAQSVLAFAVNNLNVRNVAVVGHTNCGGAAACLSAIRASSSEQTADSALARWLTPLAELARSLELDGLDQPTAVNTIVEANVKAQVENVVKSETITKAWSNDLPVIIHGWIYDLRTGILRDLGVTVRPPA